MKPPTLSTTQFFGLQIMILGAISFYFYPYLVINATSHGFWIPIVIWMLLALVGAWLFSRMMALHQGKDAFTIVKKELGWLGIVIFVLPLIWFMWRSMVIMISAHTEIIAMTILHTTPGWVLNGIIWIAVFLASGGFGSIVRTASIFLIISFPITIILFFLAMSDTHLYLGKPWLHSTGNFSQIPAFMLHPVFGPVICILQFAGNSPKRLACCGNRILQRPFASYR
ncbi:GerAB/ArcD/ProY family transporter [Paenibacillus sp. D2_2]|uniref:GerAB/ArcD/ProY family transporter n=1 Tax=Paenibacillus sp. D2_2 TaxID=3073092 RepID=UPI00281573E7|nr:GerAB/ArcD/ProY family transporter [Paenibacillus sp. D2_2]WMT39398.1 GerAB/ArcD/ProY family transporter [Paenibacillus sp. D2_2]